MKCDIANHVRERNALQLQLQDLFFLKVMLVGLILIGIVESKQI